MDSYRMHVNKVYGLSLQTSSDLHEWSVRSPHQFWIDLYSWLDLTPSLPSGIREAYDSSAPISSNPPFFTQLQGFNYAENAMFANPDPKATALIGVREDTNLANGEEEKLTWSQFRDKVRLTSSALRRSGKPALLHCRGSEAYCLHIGVQRGDRIAALVATSVWSVVLFHASKLLCLSRSLIR